MFNLWAPPRYTLPYPSGFDQDWWREAKPRRTDWSFLAIQAAVCMCDPKSVRMEGTLWLHIKLRRLLA